MAKHEPTNQNLSDRIEKLDDKVERKFHNMNTAFTKFRSDIRGQLQPFHDYLVGIEAVNKASTSDKGNGRNIIIPQIVWDVVKWMVLIIATLVGVKNL